MNQTISPEIREVIGATHYRPAVSIIMPIETRINGNDELLHQLKFAAARAEKEIRQTYSDESGEVVIKKLRNLIKNVRFQNDSKSIAIYVSPVFEKLLYLNIPVEEKIIIDESFEIRDLIYAKTEVHKYLLLLLSGKSNKVFICDSDSCMRVMLDVPDNISAYLNDAPERVTNFSDPSERKETNLKKFLHETDKGLGDLLKKYKVPVIVMGTTKILGYFKDITKHQKEILIYIHGNYEESTETELRNILKSHTNDLKKAKTGELRNRMENAANAKRLVTGIKEVWKQAMQHKGSLLVVEKKFMHAAQHGSNKDIIYEPVDTVNELSNIKDAVDDIIEKVIEYGGDVEFVDEGMLNEYQHIALIKYY